MAQNNQVQESAEIVYWLNHQDDLCFVNDSYDEFALANAGHAVVSKSVLQRPIWDFISDSTCQELYRHILKRVRSGRPIQFDFRCDSPAMRRFMQMDVDSAEYGTVEFRARTVAIELRPFQRLIEAFTVQADDQLSMCSWCKRVHVDKVWAEVEEAIDRLQLFQRPLIPKISHGICRDCYELMMDKITST